MKEEFKTFVRKNPILIKYVKNGEMTWQKFYEIFNLYNTDYDAWKDYLKPLSNKTEETSSDLLGFIKGIDLDKVQEGVKSLQRVMGVFTDMTTKDAPFKATNYKPRPIYKHFDD